MIAAAIITRIRSTGGKITLADEGIDIKVPASLRDELVAEIKTHKEEIKRSLKDETSKPWDAEDYVALYDERAGIAEFDRCMSKQAAETQALERCIIEWLNRNTVRSEPGRCAWCGLRDKQERVVVPFGTENHGHAWLHHGCWTGWFAARRQQAADTLAVYGITSV